MRAPIGVKKAAFRFLGLCAIILCLILGVRSSKADSSRKPVIAELFTSEGCSDCPPAEALARRMEQQSLPGVNLIVLEGYVTSWNHYAWFDPFSSAAWTARQMEYVDKLKKRNPYTPEMVNDGQEQFPDGDAAKAQAPFILWRESRTRM